MAEPIPDRDALRGPVREAALYHCDGGEPLVDEILDAVLGVLSERRFPLEVGASSATELRTFRPRDPDPAEEGLVLRDRDGDRWIYRDGCWWAMCRDDTLDGPHPWPLLLRYEPLVEDLPGPVLGALAALRAAVGEFLGGSGSLDCLRAALDRTEVLR